MIDMFLIIISGCSFLLFMIGLILYVRVRGQGEILSAMKHVYLTLCVLGSLSLWFFLRNTPIRDMVIVIAIYIVLFWAMSFSYILGLFGMPLTSVRIQFLLTLFAHGDSGADKETLKKEYSKDTLVNIRLHRLETSGEIVKKGNRYMLRSRWSYFVLHNIFLLFLIKLFRPLERANK